ncbi:MAG: sulfatase-like hydrolase/transferase [Pirellulales bacterium]|nr:sulfatase-like hydrolase/transferase [Pirellulales bacterium]
MMVNETVIRILKLSFVGLFLTLSPGLSVWAEEAQSETKTKPVNVLMMTADNLGYGDLHCYGNKDMKTPNLDRLAAEGVRCTDLYSSSPTCTVSRASLLTGRYPQRNGLIHQLGKEENRSGIGLRHSERLLPEFLKLRGYATACFGKWNIGFAKGSRPTERGFDEFLGHRSGNMDYYTHVYNLVHDLYRGTEPAHLEGYSTDLFADAACEFMRRHAQKPFFIYLPFNAPHYPNPGSKAPGEPCIWQAPDEAFAVYGYSPQTQDEQKRYRAVVTALDTAVGRVLDQLEALGLAENTLVIFFSDNGAFMRKGAGLGCASNGPLRTEGLKLYDGNIRVPGIVRWPGKLPAGRVCKEMLVHMDFFPMTLRATGTERELDRKIDGRDPTATLAGKAASPHQALFWGYQNARALREGNLKLVSPGKSKPWELYDLQADIGEKTNLAANKPKVVERLKKRYADWLGSMK